MKKNAPPLLMLEKDLLKWPVFSAYVSGSVSCIGLSINEAKA
jgi:hypothetical protein